MPRCFAAMIRLSLSVLGLLSLSCPASAQDLTIKSTHTGVFLAGQTNAYYLLRVRNEGTAPTSGPITITDNAPASLTITSMHGAGWFCELNSCSWNDSLAAGASAPAIMVIASVAASAGPSLTNQVTVSGGGDTNNANNTGYDVTAVAAHGYPVSWGRSDFGETSPEFVPFNLVAIAAGSRVTLGLGSNGTVTAWGDSITYGQTTIPSGLANVVAIAVGDSFCMALKSDGTIVFWGYDLWGMYSLPGYLTDIIAIAANKNRSMALKSDGTVYVSSIGPTNDVTIPSGPSMAVGIALSYYTCLVLRSDGKVDAWGQTAEVQEDVPAGLSNVVAVAGGGTHNLALKSDGTVVIWGLGIDAEMTVPPSLSNVIAIAAGDSNVLALKSDGTMVAWGHNGWGESTVPDGLSEVNAMAGGQNSARLITGIPSTTVQVGVSLSGSSGPLMIDSKSYESASVVFNWLPGSLHTIGTAAPDSTDADQRSVFQRWSDGGGIVHSVAPTRAMAYTAYFQTQYRVTTLANPPEGGTISPASGFYDASASIPFTATPATGYPFTGFTGDLLGATNPQNLWLMKPVTVTANFTTIPAPAAPVLVSPANGATGVRLDPTLSWLLSDRATAYDIYFGTSSTPPQVTTLSGGASYYDTGAMGEGTKYYWKVVARNASGSASSPIWSFTTQLPPPTPPVVAPGAPCGQTVTPRISMLTSAGGTLELAVQTTADCNWSLPALPDWITSPDTMAKTGSQTVTLTIASNPGAARSAQINISGIEVTINQAAPCLCKLGAFGQGHTAAGGTGTIQVLAAQDCFWALSAPPGWVSYTGYGAGTGNADVEYTVAQNEGTRRTATVTVGGAAFAIDQNGAKSSPAGTLAHFAEGAGWLTRFTLVNTGYVPAHAQLNFFDDAGNPVSESEQTGHSNLRPSTSGDLDFVSSAASDGTLNPGAVLHVNAPTSRGGDSVESTGWAQLLSDGMVNGYGVFQLKTEAGIQEAVVPPETRNASVYYLPFDNTGGYFYGVALSSAAGLPVNIGVEIRDAETGQTTRRDLVSLEASGHTAFVMTKQFPDTANTRGTLKFTSAYQGSLTVLGLRFNADHSFTSVPVLVATPVLQGQGLVTVGSMPHIAAGGGWKTLFTLSNPGTIPAKAHLNFFGDDGKPLKVTYSLPQAPSFAAYQAATFEQTLAPGTMLEIEADGGVNTPAGASVQGWAQLQSDGSVTGFAAYQYQPGKGGQQEAVVPLEMRGAASYILPFDNTNGYVNGVALANTGGQTAAVAVTIRDAATGAVLDTDTINLPVQGHMSFLLKDRYAKTTTNAAVTVEFKTTAAGQVSVLGLRVNADKAFTSVPALVKR